MDRNKKKVSVELAVGDVWRGIAILNQLVEIFVDTFSTLLSLIVNQHNGLSSSKLSQIWGRKLLAFIYKSVGWVMPD